MSQNPENEIRAALDALPAYLIRALFEYEQVDEDVLKEFARQVAPHIANTQAGQEIILNWLKEKAEAEGSPHDPAAVLEQLPQALQHESHMLTNEKEVKAQARDAVKRVLNNVAALLEDDPNLSDYDRDRLNAAAAEVWTEVTELLTRSNWKELLEAWLQEQDE